MRVVIGLGANLGDRLSTLRAAVDQIELLAPVLARSSVWETLPVGGPKQPDYFNAAVAIAWDGEPLALLDALQRIEHDFGRVREVRYGPRTLDLDILWIEDRIIDDPRLSVPHPRLHERAFALVPLLEVAADAPFASPALVGVERRMPL